MTDNFDGDLKDGSAEDVSCDVMCRWDEFLAAEGAEACGDVSEKKMEMREARNNRYREDESGRGS